MKTTASILLILLAMSCQNRQQNIEGRFIDKIVRNTITFVDGSSYDLQEGDNTKIFYLVRHAEKDTIPAKNPILTEAGYERSFRLAEIFKSTKLDAVYSTLYNRTMHTVDSLTQIKGLSTIIYQPKDMKTLGATLTTSPKENRVLIAGHSNTTPAFAGVLMGSTQYDNGFDESDYDNLLIVEIDSDGVGTLHKLRYK